MHRRALPPNQKKNILPCITLTFLSFLKSRSSKGNLDRNTDPIDEDEDGLTSMSGGSFAVGQNVIDCLTPQPTPLLPKKSQINLSDVNKSAYEYFSRKTKQINTKEQYVGDSDADMAFFRSMLPDVKGMTRDQKIKFKIGVLNLIGQILKEPSNSPISYSRSSLRTESPYQRTPSRESEYGSSVQLRSYGSPIHEPALHQTQPTPQQTQITGTYGASELQQTQKTGAYGGSALQQTDNWCLRRSSTSADADNRCLRRASNSAVADNWCLQKNVFTDVFSNYCGFAS
ncbi:unnamed protein product [Arctia plantaginis]|uniref:BESS domain-containing protein n=1 Tax=Arctia plantaginis TaxID=874455 RepID=A0A8S0ZGJ6_ARCPL|nr:unnamed protein product [Arctia plantaginis]CAB3252440.1 unnamed protein product [Arctia plantaginis]